MAASFDPYHRWLGIPRKHQPPNHYRLLGIEMFEADPEVIETAADQRMMLLRTFQAGKHADDSQRLLNEVSAAKVCLLSAARKAEYDAQLRTETGEEHAAEKRRNDVAAGLLEALPPLAPAPPLQTAPPLQPATPHVPGRPGGPLGVGPPTRQRPLWQRTPFLLAVGLGGLLGSVLLIVLLAQPWTSGQQTRRGPGPGQTGRRTIPRRPVGGRPPQPPQPPSADGNGGDPVAPSPPDPRQEPIRAAGPGEFSFGRDQLLALYTFESATIEQRDGRQFVRDLSGNNRDAVIEGAVPAAGRAGAGLYFDGSDDYLAAPNLRDALLGLESLTVCIWCRGQRAPREYRDAAVFFDVGSWGHKSITLCVGKEGAFLFTLPGDYGGGDARATTPVDTAWHHLAGVWDGAEMRLLVDGTVRARRATTNLALTNRSLDPFMVRLGGQAKMLFRRGRFFRGALDEFALLSAALSDDEVRQVFEAGERGELLWVRD